MNFVKFLRTLFLQNISGDCVCKFNHCKPNPHSLKPLSNKNQIKEISTDCSFILYFNVCSITRQNVLFRSSRSEVFLGKGVLKICSKFTGEHPCRSAILIKLQ